MLTSLLLVLTGFAALYQGGNALLAGASGIAKQFGLPPMLIGLTVVAFATSAPELAVSILAALKGTPDIAVGNVLGSNIFNSLVAIGTVAVLVPVVVPRTLLSWEIPLGVCATVLVGGMAWTGGGLVRWEGAVLLGSLVVVLGVSVRRAMGGRTLEPPATQADDSREAELDAGAAGLVVGASAGALVLDAASMAFTDFAVPGAALLTLLNARFYMRKPSLLVRSFSVLFGLLMLVLGSDALVEGASDIALSLGVSQGVVGLTVVAIGTSAPELATAVAAARRGEIDLALGNALGSNTFNLLAVLGAAAVITDVPVGATFLRRDLPVALGSSLALMLPWLTRGKLDRAVGVVMLAGWVVYTTLLVVQEIR